MSESPAEPTTTESTPESTATAPETPARAEPDWKARAREWEKRAKDNAEKAKRFDEVEESSKSEQQKAADRAAAAERAANESKAEALRYRAAAKHGIGEDEFDLIGSGDADEIDQRAQRVGELLAASRERDGLKAEIDRLRAENEALRTGKPIPATGRPVEQLAPGATPGVIQPVVDDTYPAHWLPASAGTRSG